MAVVQSVDQESETARLIPLLRAKLRDIIDQYGMETFGEREIIGRSQRGAANRVERKSCHPIDGSGDNQLPTEHLNRKRLAPPGIGQLPPCLVHGLGRGGYQRRVVNVQTCDAVQPVIARAVQLDQFQVLLDERNEWNKQLPVQSAFIKAVRLCVRGEDNYGAKREQLLAQAAEYHRVRHIEHLEFIETKQRRICCDVPSRGFNGIVSGRARVLRPASFLSRSEIPPLVNEGV